MPTYDDKNKLIKHMGQAFQMYYKKYESYFIECVNDIQSLVLLDGITHCFKNNENALDTLGPLLCHIGQLDIGVHSILYLMTSPATELLADPHRSYGMIIEGLIGIYGLDTTHHNYFEAAMILMVANTLGPQVLGLEQRYPSEIKRFFNDYFSFIIDMVLDGNIQFIFTCWREGLIDVPRHIGMLLRHVIPVTLTIEPGLNTFISGCPDPTGTWIIYIDIMMELRCLWPSPTSFTHDLLKKLGRFKANHRLAIHIVDAYFNATDRLRLNVHEHCKFEKSLYSGLKPLNRSPFTSSSKQSISQSLPRLPLLTLKQIVTLLVLDDTMTPRWKVMLAGVSKLFHQTVAKVMSSHPIPSIHISSMINHIGSQFCLFLDTPLHLTLSELSMIPHEHLNHCINRIESIILPYIKTNTGLWSISVLGPNLNMSL
ncbi:hypothetical protein SAMD00019534_098850 [Acytostelium subglobosum LB1]|uniref:hypothetical protein n=1 Tax=Acytostelium subglobosum LB1 TaxID=1410327 RepID=UPI00064500DB|nr:hypothetical protein SAMD00019534_098850 [Acytostelium subglobosum LB1]GAM26710.1 hypothetical protein SAMD00019534_098850 [Acytostelium subglobosum LB1]|eukprot:XP_012750371.1 hypothetical protein SAMD00019534_098850 [Acytostelium subglobosum LB1]